MSRTPKTTLIDRIAITKRLVGHVSDLLSGISGCKYNGCEHNEVHDKVDFSITYKNQHYWLVLLRESSRVPIRKGSQRATESAAVRPISTKTKQTGANRV